ncbi:hypothetical protein KI387_037199 [Taxus chinensis]|uniref:Peptidase A1 domain-containing protein n=1 Tax=Taxus chinensis TaxID=29808 RepID=A0AA38KQ93_TAXCH|nr:hypothetical protein KI387_037199 [Taxus chinensis]
MVLDTGNELSWLNYNISSKNAPPHLLLLSIRISPLPTPQYPATPQSTEPKRRNFQSPQHGTDIEGNLARDYLSLPGLTIPSFVFGCSFSAPLPETPAIMGLYRGALSLISQLNTTHKFSYCIADRVISLDSAGVLLFGDSPFSKYLNYTPLLIISILLPYFNRAAYNVILEGIKVGEKMLPIPKSVFLPDHTGARQTMIDFGTQFTLLLGEAYTVLKREFTQQNRGRMNPMNRNAVFQGALDLCYDLLTGSTQFLQVTPVTLIFNSTQLMLDSHELLYRVRNGTSINREIYCFTFTQKLTDSELFSTV